MNPLNKCILRTLTPRKCRRWLSQIGKNMKNHFLFVSFLALLMSVTALHARSWVSGKEVTRVYDQRPHKTQLDIHITPNHNECNVISFVVGENGLTDEHLKSIQSTALAALMSGKVVGGLWDDPDEGCKGTNLHISK